MPLPSWKTDSTIASPWSGDHTISPLANRIARPRRPGTSCSASIGQPIGPASALNASQRSRISPTGWIGQAEPGGGARVGGGGTGTATLAGIVLHVPEQYGHRERDKRDYGRFLEEQQPTGIGQYAGEHIAAVTGAHQQDRVGAHPCQGRQHR